MGIGLSYLLGSLHYINRIRLNRNGVDTTILVAYLNRIRLKRMRFKASRKDFAMTEKLLMTGKTHNKGGRDGFALSSDGKLDIKLPQPHPAAEQLFGAAWSACYMGAIEVAATQRGIKLPAGAEVDAEIDLNVDDGSYFLRARLNVSVPDIDRDVARQLIHAAHEICPYSKAIRGNIDLETNLI
jgi:osmotically inducible protein OsmC